jgi:hypothetical protein
MITDLNDRTISLTAPSTDIGTTKPVAVNSTIFSLGTTSSGDVSLARDAANTFAQRNAANTQIYRLYKSFADVSNYTRAAWQFNANGVVLAGESAGTGDANIGFSFGIKGTGAFQLQQTDNTATGGNLRGANAIDLQTSRTLATQVSSGANSFTAGISNIAPGIASVSLGNGNTGSGAAAIALGQTNTASGGESAAIGRSNTSSGISSIAQGLSNTASGTASIAQGFTNSASGVASIAQGQYASTKSIASLWALGTSVFAVAGTAQTVILSLGKATADATPTVLTSNNAAAATTNQLTLQNISSITFTAIVTATTTSGGNCSSWELKGMIQRGANAASTTLVAAVVPTLIAQKVGAATWAVAVTADTINGCLAVTVTGQAATGIRWNCSIFATEVAF